MPFILLSPTAQIGPGQAHTFPVSDTVKVIQFSPYLSQQGFTGVVSIEGSMAGTPGPNDWQTLITVTFSNRSGGLSLDIARNDQRICGFPYGNSIWTKNRW